MIVVFGMNHLRSASLPSTFVAKSRVSFPDDTDGLESSALTSSVTYREISCSPARADALGDTA
ncbi:putative signal peptide protein [Halorubrum sp. AJ67]|nr:putative signal peptide protein [Halorubrum sp. AJ67]